MSTTTGKHGFYLLALVTACLITTGCGNKKSEQKVQYERAIGQLLGEQVAALAPSGGKVVVLLRRGSGEQEAQRNQAYLDGLNLGLNSDSFQIQEAGPDLSTVKPQHQTMVIKAVTEGWPARAFLGWCAVDRDAVAVVSFIEFPYVLRARTLSKLPPLFACSTTGTKALRILASQGAIRTAIFARSGFDKEAVPPKKASAEEIVRLRYEVISS